MNHGLITPKIETHEEGVNHVLGSSQLPEPVVNSSGDWMPYLPDREPQKKNGVETFACTVYGTLSAIEEAVYKATGSIVNYSDRYIANVAKRSGILDPNVGADPHKIAELIRTISGNIREDRAPWTDDIKTTGQYYALGDEIFQLLKEGPAWYDEWELNHKWVFTGGTPQEKREKLQDALTKGTVCVSVDAWMKINGLYYKPKGSIDNHWVSLVQAHNTDPYKVFDSYDTFVKDLDPLYDFGMGKVYFLTLAKSKPFLKNLYFQIVDPEVQRLQRALVSLRYVIPHAVTSVYGIETKSAVMSFQRDHGIVDDGSHFGPRTRQALNVALNPAAPFGGSLITLIQSLFSGV